jgi:hypothetical protein
VIVFNVGNQVESAYALLVHFFFRSVSWRREASAEVVGEIGVAVFWRERKVVVGGRD